MYEEKLREFRERNDLTQKNIADILGIAEITYTHYENGYYIIPLKYLNDACNHLDISLDFVFNFTNNQNYLNSKKEIDRQLFSERLKKFRKENKLTQTDIANLLNSSRSAVAEYERGTNLIATPFLYTICKKYHISADYLLGKIDEPMNIK